MEQLTEEQRKTRVVIAEEVLLGIEAGTIKPNAGAYVKITQPGARMTWHSYTKSPLVELNGHPCETCGIGSLVAGIVRRGLVRDEEGVKRVLTKYFDEKTLFELEAVFMGEGFDAFLMPIPLDAYADDENEDEDPGIDAAPFRPWWKKYAVPGELEGEQAPNEDEEGYEEWKAAEQKSLTDVLRAMMENIVRNNGEFVVTDLR